MKGCRPEGEGCSPPKPERQELPDYIYYIYYGERQSAHLSLHDVVLEVSGQAVDKREDSDEQDV